MIGVVNNDVIEIDWDGTDDRIGSQWGGITINTKDRKIDTEYMDATFVLELLKWWKENG